MPDPAAFLSYVFLTIFTPGPNNIMAMSTAGKYGFKKAFRFCVGVWLGFLAVVISGAVFSALLAHLVPKYKPVMVYISAAYILWLAWTIYRDKPHQDGKPLRQPGSILTGITLQFINVKGILFSITVFSTFILPFYNGAAEMIFFVVVFSAMVLVSTCCWALFGSLFQKLFTGHKNALNLVMALLLVYCAVSILLNA